MRTQGKNAIGYRFIRSCARKLVKIIDEHALRARLAPPSSRLQSYDKSNPGLHPKYQVPGTQAAARPTGAPVVGSTLVRAGRRHRLPDPDFPELLEIRSRLVACERDAAIAQLGRPHRRLAGRPDVVRVRFLGMVDLRVPAAFGVARLSAAVAALPAAEGNGD